MHFKCSNISPILLRQNRNCLDGVDYKVVPSFFSMELKVARLDFLGLIPPNFEH